MDQNYKENPINLDEIDLSKTVNFFFNFFKYLFFFKYYFIIVLILITLITYLFGYNYNKRLDQIIESKTIIVPPSEIMKNKLDLPSYLVLPNVLDYYMSILTNKLNFNNFLKKYELDTNAIKLEVSFKIPLFEEVQEINSKPTEPRIFIILIINTKYLKDYNFKTLNKINDDFSSHYENIFNNALKTYLIKQVNDLESSSMNNLNAIKNIRSNLDNLETINEKKPLTDHFILFFFKEEIERLQNDLLTGKKIKSELSLKKYSNLFVHKYLLLKDVTKYINYYKVLPIVIIIIFIFISFFLFLINFSFFYKSKK